MPNYLLRTALPLSSWSLLFAWASKALASSCSMPAFLLASADSSVFLAMSSSTVLYLPLSSLLRTCSEFKHKVELKWSQYCGIWLLLPLPFTNPAARAGSSLNKSRKLCQGISYFPSKIKSCGEDSSVALLQTCGCFTASILALGRDLWDSATGFCN